MTDPPDHVAVTGLSVWAGSERRLLDQVDLTLAAGELVALVGASGSGKTLCARALVGLLAASLRCEGRLDVQSQGRRWQVRVQRPEQAFEVLRGAVLTWLGQHAHAALDPLWSVERHLRFAAQDGAARPEELLARAGFSRPEAVLPLFPHELSGGMAQRVAVAQALARGARFLLADEPTTALDPRAQRQVLRVLGRLREEGVGVLLITHDLRIVPRLADRVVVIDQGAVVEQLAAGALWSAQHAVTRRLLEATAAVAGGAL